MSDINGHSATSRHAGLTRKQEQGIVALLSHQTLAAAAADIRLNAVTLRRWLRQPAFREAYREARRDAVAQAVAAVQNATGEAVETLRGVMGDAEAAAGARVSAARTVLDTAIKGVELDDLSARLDALEERLKEPDR